MPSERQLTLREIGDRGGDVAAQDIDGDRVADLEADPSATSPTKETSGGPS